VLAIEIRESCSAKKSACLGSAACGRRSKLWRSQHKEMESQRSGKKNAAQVAAVLFEPVLLSIFRIAN
jgi:hypothetical protein